MTKATFFIVSVEYTEGLDDQAATQASYAGVSLRVSYGPNISVTERFATGDFAADYFKAATEYQRLVPEADVPFMASSTLDSFMFEAGYAFDGEAA